MRSKILEILLAKLRSSSKERIGDTVVREVGSKLWCQQAPELIWERGQYSEYHQPDRGSPACYMNQPHSCVIRWNTCSARRRKNLKKLRINNKSYQFSSKESLKKLQDLCIASSIFHLKWVATLAYDTYSL